MAFAALSETPFPRQIQHFIAVLCPMVFSEGLLPAVAGGVATVEVVADAPEKLHAAYRFGKLTASNIRGLSQKYRITDAWTINDLF